ncbi:hypothetical protein [Frondihabitans australicus]|nr:hypothetical protein [Frondihabitans australicus]
MAGQRIVMKGRSLDEIAARVREEHGPRARIVEAARVTSGGIGIAGLFQKRYVEATVELPERGRRAAGRPAADPATGPGASADEVFAPTPAQRVGLAALLADADDADEGFDGILTGSQEPSPAAPSTPPVPPQPKVSTRSDAFAELMDDLAFNGVVPAPAPAPSPVVAPGSTPGHAAQVREERQNVESGGVGADPAPSRFGGQEAPALLDGPGDLIVVLGERPDVLGVAQAIAEGSTGTRPSVRVAGTAVNGRFVAVDDRRSALDARAAGVELDRATIVALGWDAAAPSAAGAIVEALAADQVLIAVDAGRKHADTERWFAQATGAVVADGLAVHGLDSTSTPETVDTLALPAVWRDA